jgi:hypothetical protein
MEIFAFKEHMLRDESGELKASVVEDEKGIHLVE